MQHIFLIAFLELQVLLKVPVHFLLNSLFNLALSTLAAATKLPLSTGSCVSGSPSSGIESCWIKKCRNSDFFLFSITKSIVENRHKSQLLYSIFDLMVIEWQSFVLNFTASIWNMMQSTVYCLLSWWAVLLSKDMSSLLFSSRRLSSSWFSFRWSCDKLSTSYRDSWVSGLSAFWSQ